MVLDKAVADMTVTIHTRLLPALMVATLLLCTAQRAVAQRSGSFAQFADTTSQRNTETIQAPPGQPTPRFEGIAYQDTVAMLMVLVRFQDDNHGDCGAWWCHEERWPHLDLFGTGDVIPRTRLPDWAPKLLESDPARINNQQLSLQDSSLSAYYYWQSRTGPAGPHVLYGDVWPEVYITEHANRGYYSRRDSMGTSVRRKSGFGYLTAEMLDNLVEDGLDLGRYDHNQDGVVDQIMMIIRRDSLYMGQGWGTLAGYYNVAGMPDRDGDLRPDTLKYWSDVRRDSIRVDWSHSGSQNLTADVGMGLLVHEYGHRIMGMGGHLPMIQYEERVPGQKVECAYARMCGLPNAYDPASLTLSAHERRRMGWLDPVILDPRGGDREAIEIRDLYNSGDAVFVPLGEGAAADTLTIVNRQRLGYFDVVRAVPSLHPDFEYVYKGLATRGLQVALSDGEPSGSFGRYRYGFLPADGVYERRSRCSGDHDGCPGPNTYHGDLYSPEWVDQLTPWTRPSSSGFRRAELITEGVEPQWFALDRIRYVPDDRDSTMQFDFVVDVRQRPSFLTAGNPWPVIRVDSWIGPESTGLVFENEVFVERGATLHIGADTLSNAFSGSFTSLGAVQITFRRGLRLEDGAQLIVGPDSEVIVEGGILGGAGAEFVIDAGAMVNLGRGVRFEGSRLGGEPDQVLLDRFRTR